jgi:serine protease AprX
MTDTMPLSALSWRATACPAETRHAQAPSSEHLVMHSERSVAVRPLLLAAVAGAAALSLAAAPAGSAIAQAAVPSAPVGAFLLTVRDGAQAAAAAAVTSAGGEVVARMPDLSVLSVHLPAAGLGRVLRDPAVLGAREEGRVTVAGTIGDRPAPTTDVYRQEIRSDRAEAAGATGTGVTVALVDTGVAPLPQLRSRLVPVTDDLGRTASCVNLTSEPTCDDGFGHGTFLASLIAGDGTGPTAGTALRGMSTARVLSVKIGGASGTADTTTLLAGLQWVVAHKDRYGIGVLNLSLGTPAGDSWHLDPLNVAVEHAVDAGIAVVVAAGNTGPDPQTVTKPGDDPLVLTVGASDDRGTPGRSDDLVPRFSAQGPTKADLLAKPDVVAPGARLVGLRSPGSTVEQTFPGGVDSAYRRGSGTSMAAAVVSGAAAQLLSAHPDLTPAQVKGALMGTATPVAGQPASVIGKGLIDVQAALGYTGPPADQPVERSDGSGSLADASGGLVFSLLPPDPLTGALLPYVGVGFDEASYLADPSWTETGWRAGQFATTIWQTPQWQTTNWTTTNWTTTNWTTTNWTTTNWTTTNWTTTNWTTTNWTGTTDGEQASYGRPGRNSANLGAWE